MRFSTLLVFTRRKIHPARFNRRFFNQSFWNDERTVVTEASIKDRLTSNSVPFVEGYSCLLVKRCICQKFSSRHETGDIFINKRTGSFLCEQCKVTGEWDSFRYLLEKAKGDADDVKASVECLERYDKEHTDWKGIMAESTSLENLSNDVFDEVVNEFDLKNCTKAVMGKLKIRMNNERDVLYFPLSCWDSPVVGYKTYCKDGTEKTFPRMDCPGFLLHPSRIPSQAAIVVSNIPDFLALISQNLCMYDVACLQHGPSHLPQMTLPFFEKYNKIILWLGEKSMDAAGTLSRKFNEKRCYIVRATGNQLSPSVALSKNENIRGILSDAKLTWHKYVTTFGAFRDELMVELQHSDEAAGVPWKRFPRLTKLLKGHRRGEVTVLTGPTGVGKTTFLSEYSLDLAMQGVNTLWGSFEVKNSRLLKMLLTQYGRAPIPTDLKDYNALCDKFEQLPLFFLSFHGQQDVPNVMEAINHCSYTYDIAHVIIDNIQFMIGVCPDNGQFDRFWRQDYTIQTFRDFATRNNCHVTLVMHPKKIEGIDLDINSIFGGVKASQEADNVLIIQRKELNSFLVKKYLQVCKNRYDGDLGMFPLDFEKSSLCFSSPPTDESEIPENDTDLSLEMSEENI